MEPMGEPKGPPDTLSKVQRATIIYLISTSVSAMERHGASLLMRLESAAATVVT
jgi:hypothetical protein